MAQILVTIDESITTNSIRHAIGMLKGVISTSLYNTEKKVSKKKAQETYGKTENYYGNCVRRLFTLVCSWRKKVA